MLPRMIDKDSAHDLRHDAEEVPATLPIDLTLIEESQVGLMNQSRRLQRVIDALMPELTHGDAPEFPVDDGQQTGERVPVALTPVLEDRRYVRRGTHLTAVTPSDRNLRDLEMRGEPEYRRKRVRRERKEVMSKQSVKVAWVCLVVAMAISSAAKSLAAGAERSRDDDGQRPLHITKECSNYTGDAGSFCTITSSNIAQIPAGAVVTYDQAAGIPAGLLDSNVILDAGDGNRAIGRCTLDDTTGQGLCTFSDGTGDLAGFHARARVLPPSDGLNWHWDGVFGFDDVDR
jgi:hypothetical protein